MSVDMGDDFPEIRKHMRAMAVAKAPEPVVLSPLEEVAKQLRLANLIQWAGITNNHNQYAAEIEEGLRT